MQRNKNGACSLCFNQRDSDTRLRKPIPEKCQLSAWLKERTSGAGGRVIAARISLSKPLLWLKQPEVKNKIRYCFIRPTSGKFRVTEMKKKGHGAKILTWKKLSNLSIT